jgi:hypothetical protein
MVGQVAYLLHRVVTAVAVAVVVVVVGSVFFIGH